MNYAEWQELERLVGVDCYSIVLFKLIKVVRELEEKVWKLVRETEDKK
jgi:hypothetical protein